MARNQVRLDIEPREPVAGGGSFGNSGPYERLFGKAHFAIDPDEKGLPSIVDLDLAPRNAQGLVEFAATLDIMKPVEPGRGIDVLLYEFIYETEGSRVMNLGFLGIRDLLSLLRYETHDAAGNPNPLAGHVEKVYGTGASLSGRVIREYVYEGWNVDAAGRRVFDAVHTHTGSGRLFQNQRFAQVGRYPRQHEEHQWPAEYYPFTYVAVPDPFTERNEGLWQRPETDPLVIHLHTEGDYWVRHVSLTHTDPRDGSDVEIPEKARMYHLTGAPHMVRAMDDPDWIGQLTPNAISAIPFRRAILVLLDRWATDGSPRRRRSCQRQRTARWSRPRRCSPGTPRARASTYQRDRAACHATTMAPISTAKAS